MYERLDRWRERVAALLPVPPAVEAHADVAERVVQAGTDALSSGQPPAPAGLRRQLADAAAHVRDQAAAAYYRSVDPTPLAGVRPGAARRRSPAASRSAAATTTASSRASTRSRAHRRCAQPGGEPKPKPQRARARAAAGAGAAGRDADRDRADADADAAPRRPRADRAAAAAGRRAEPTPPPAPQDEYEPRRRSRTRRDAGQAARRNRAARRRHPRAGRGSSTDHEHDSREETSMRRTPPSVSCRRRGAQRAPALLLAGAASRASTRSRTARPTRWLQHARVRRLRHARHEDQARVQPGGPGPARARSPATSIAARTRAARRGRDGAITAPPGPVHELPLGRHGAPARLPLRAAALCRGARHRADRDQERARQPALPAPPRAQAAGYRSRTFNVTGATRIVQRVICVGGDGRKSCSARGANYIRTYKAEVRGRRRARRRPQRSSPTRRSPRGEWVGGNQPLNYTAERQRRRAAWRTRSSAAARRIARSGRACSRTPEGAFADRIPCPNGPGQISVDTTRDSRRARSRSSSRPRTRPATSARPRAVTARIDNTPPDRVDVAVDGGEQWRNRNDFAVAWANPPEGDRAPIAAASYRLCPAGGGSCTQRRRRRRRHRALRRAGAGARRVDGVAVAPGRGRQRDRQAALGAGHAAL